MTLLGIAALLFGLAKLIEWLVPDDRTRSSSTPPLAAEGLSAAGGELLRDDPRPRRLSETPSFGLEHLAQPRIADAAARR
jgi:hypothetical protein